MRTGVMCLACAAFAACGRYHFASEPDASEPDGVALPFCTTVPSAVTFCDDFEDGTIGGFDSTNTFEGALVVEPAAAHASHFGMAASTQMLSAVSPTADADAELDLSTQITNVDVAFDLQVVTVGTSDLVIVEIAMDDGVQMHNVEYVYRGAPGTSYIEDVVEIDGSGNPSYNYYQLTSATPNAWHRVDIHITNGPAAACTVTHDGTLALQTALAGTTGGTPRFFLGAPYISGPANSWAVDLDNIVLVTD